MDDDLQILTLPYNSDLYSVYKKTNNVKIIVILILQILLTVIHWLLSFVFPIQAHEFFESSKDENDANLKNAYNLTIYCHLLLWLLTLMIRHYLKNYYYRRLRILGYNNHYKNVESYFTLPSKILHKSNALLLLATILLYNLHMKSFTVLNVTIRAIHIAEVIITIVSVAIVVIVSFHLFHETRFRRLRNPPDVFCVDDPSRRLTSDGLNQVVIRSSSFLEDLLENQADLIYNLKLQNSHLRELLYKATNPSAAQAGGTN